MTDSRVRVGMLVWTCCAILLVSLAGCSRSASGPHAGQIELVAHVEPQAEPFDGPRFELLESKRTRIDFEHRWAFPENKFFDTSTLPTWSGGVCIGDYDGDGLPDLYLTRPYAGGRLYRNLGDFRFQDVTKKAGIADPNTWGTGTAFVDIDRDGDLDLYVCAYDGPNRLYVNQGDGTFLEQAQAFGLAFSGSSIMMAFADYDRDGDLDGYLLTNQLHRPTKEIDAKLEFRNGRWVVPDQYQQTIQLVPPVPLDGSLGPPERFHAGQFDHLYRNNGDGTFTDVSPASLGDSARSSEHGLAAVWWDYNGDQWPDLYVSNDFWGSDHLYRNNCDGTFTDVAPSALPHTPWFSMGADAADINNDGLVDFMGSDMSGTNHYRQKVGMGDMTGTAWFLNYGQPRQYMRNALYLNTGAERFMEIAQMTHLANTDWTWSLKFADLDSDGWVDLFISNGMTRDWSNSDLMAQAEKLGGKNTPEGRRFWLNQPKKSDENQALRNLGDLKFESVGKAWGLDHFGVSFGAAFGDLDRDGDLDLVVNNYEQRPSVYRNRSESRDGHRVTIRLRGQLSDRYGIGATLRINTTSGSQIRYLTPSHGFMSADEPLVHFGLGQAESIDRLEVDWPSGHAQSFENLAANHHYTITEPQGQPPEAPSPPELSPDLPKNHPKMFVRSQALQWVEHVERPFEDYRRQPLLPQKMSQLGPGLASADVDGDGDEDMYVGGGAGQAGMLQLNDGEGQFTWAPLDSFAVDAACEDMAPLFFDADADGDMDLYVVSGGVECEPGDPVLRDRLYLNDGTGSFVRAPEDALPDLRDSGSVACAADFDRDGDLDLFVGGRIIPGAYPLSPDSRLLRNEGGQFTEVTDEVAANLRRTGLVTSAVWSDVDNDGWIDLLVAHEWAMVKLFRNQQGQLQEVTDEAGLTKWTGWWNGIAPGDVDRDGDMDYVVTNFGLNTKYHIGPDKPVVIYYGDFDGTGKKRLVEANYEGDVLYPVRGRSCSTNAIPMLGGRFTSFNDFALASIPEIYTPTCLSEAKRFEIKTLESGVFINNGQGYFAFRPLPRLAQVSPGFGVVVTEVDGDGNPDVYIVQNFYSPQAETGRMDGGVSLLLTGNGDGTFKPIWPNRSGLVVGGDAKGLAATDFNGDGRIDFVVGVNDGQVLAFEQVSQGGTGSVSGGEENRTPASSPSPSLKEGGAYRVCTIRLKGPVGNPTGIGARVSIQLDDNSIQTGEVHAGSSYLSQSSPVLTFGLGSTARIERIEVRWPDGKLTEGSAPSDSTRLSISWPTGSIMPMALLRAKTNTTKPSVELAQAHAELGSTLHARRRTDGALRQWQRALEIDPKNVLAHHELGRVSQSRGKLEAAITYYQQAIRLDPARAETHFRAGQTLAQQGNHAKAIEHFRKVLQLKGNDALAQFELGFSLQSQGNMDEAIDHYLQARQVAVKKSSGSKYDQDRYTLLLLSHLEHSARYYQTLLDSSESAQAHLKLGTVRRLQGKHDEAVDQLGRALRLAPDSAPVHAELGIVYISQDKLDEAIDHLRQAVSLAEDVVQFQLDLGAALRARGQIDEAIRHHRIALQLDAANPHAHYNLGVAFLVKKDLESAIRHFHQTLEINRDDADAHNNLGTALLSQNKDEQALDHFRQAVQINPNHAQAHFNLGMARRGKGQLDEAIEHLREAVRINVQFASAHNQLATALVSLGKKKQAIEHFRQALSVEPDWLDPMNNVAWLLATHVDAQVRNPPLAIIIAQRAAELTKHRHPDILDTLATAYASAGQFDEAVTTARNALALASQADDEPTADDIRRHLDIFLRREPVREY